MKVALRLREEGKISSEEALLLVVKPPRLLLDALLAEQVTTGNPLSILGDVDIVTEPDGQLVLGVAA
jgi:hypothetical protein